MKIYTLKQFIEHVHSIESANYSAPGNYYPKRKYSLTKTKIVKPAKTLTKWSDWGTPEIVELEPAVKKTIDDTNGITKLIVDYFRFVHGSESIRRISSEGNYRKGIGFIKSSNKGMSDVEGIVNGKYWSIELKTGKDRQQESQKKRQAEIEKDGGVYWLLKWIDFETFQREFYQVLEDQERRVKEQEQIRINRTVYRHSFNDWLK